MPAEPTTYVIFGATGNLARKKLIPALYHLEKAERLPENTSILAVGRRSWDRERWLDEVRTMLEASGIVDFDESVFARFARRHHFFRGDLTEEASYEGLAAQLEDAAFPPNVVFYMSIRPAEYGMVIGQLDRVGLLGEEGSWRRVVIEKPIGYDLESAQALQKTLARHLREEQIYRIDHYLGKGTVQNVLVFRFANLMLEPLWNRNYIDHVQITHSEEIGIEGRAEYYDGAGALRDMVQSHLLQLLALVAMEPPISMEAESLRDEKVKVLKSIRPIPPSAVHACAFRAQYAAGNVGGTRVPAYLDEPDVVSDSVTETYAALRLHLDTWRWRGVPFYLRTGKRLAKAQSLICIRFKHPPQQFFHGTEVQCTSPNWMLIGIQPEECMRMEMTVKVPGLEMRTRQTTLDASFRIEGDYVAEAYEDLLLDVIEGDRSLFLRWDEVEYAWRIVDPILRVWASERDFIHTYPAGSWGPPESRRLFEKEDHRWRHSLDPECF